MDCPVTEAKRARRRMSERWSVEPDYQKPFTRDDARQRKSGYEDIVSVWHDKYRNPPLGWRVVGPKKRTNLDATASDPSVELSQNMLTGTAQNLSFTFGTEDFDNQLGAAVLQTIGDFINRGMELMFLGSISKADFGLIQPILASNGYSHLHKERPSQVVDVIAFQNQTFDILQEMSSVIKDDIVEEAKKSGIPYDISTSVDGDATCLVISIQEKRSGNILVTAFANITATPLTRPELRLVQIVSALKRAAHMVPSPDAALMCCVCGIGEPNYSFRRAVRCGKLTTADQDTFAHIKTVPLQYGGVMSLPMVAFNLYMHDIKDLHHLDLNMNTAVIYTGELLSVRPVDDGDLTDSMTIKMH